VVVGKVLLWLKTLLSTRFAVPNKCTRPNNNYWDDSVAAIGAPSAERVRVDKYNKDNEDYYTFKIVRGTR
jgi:hypothetical protein